MKFPRASGVLLHPTSLPGEFGIGDLGPEAYKFVDFLADAKLTYWQILPLGPTGWGDSPYAGFSAFAGNALLISPEELSTDAATHAKIATEDPARVDYGKVHTAKTTMLRAEFEARGDDAGDDFDSFVTENASWLDDYALYRALKTSNGERPWYEWPDELKLRDPAALESATRDLEREIRSHKFYQLLFFEQWAKLKSYANEKGVKIVGDVPIFVALDSVDVWRYREQFKLNEDGSPRVVAGVPPDYFSKTGQLWGNPVYDWEAMQADDFSWWIDRIRQTLKTVDVARIDHFRGFGAVWEVPGGDPTAEHGEWVDAPGRELFAAINDALGDIPFWVEDLGFMTPEIEALRDDFDFPGMRILQFAFGGDARNEALPHNYIRHCIAYTGTHDNDTAVGWWKSLADDNRARDYCMEYVNTDGTDINWAMIRALWSSVADTVVVPAQDLLGLDNSARMNLPATTDGNWQWRLKKGDLTDEIAERLRDLTETYGRVAL
jgi:4-alpha-glucanotransferase